MKKKKTDKKTEKQNISEVIVEGTVVGARPNAMFDVQLDNGSIVLCSICGKIKINHIRITLGDRCQIGISVYDLHKGRILYRL